jgi:hypothetical protein
MKVYPIIVISILSLFLVSCDLGTEVSYTPEIQLTDYPILNDKSLNCWLTDVKGTLKLDTISVGDTVQFKVAFQSFENNIKSIYINPSDTSVAEIILPEKESMDSIFSTLSDYKAGKFLVSNNIQTLYFPFQYKAKKVGLNEKITILVESDAVFKVFKGTNTNSLIIKTPIVLSK